MASLFETLAISGHRKSTGAANASGRAWFYVHGTQTLATVYEDADEEGTADNPITLDAGGRAEVYFTGKVDVLFEDSTGLSLNTLTLTERAERVEVVNDGWTGLLPSGSQGAGGVTDLDTVLSRLFASTGGLDGKYKEYAGATARTLQSVIRGIHVSVKDYGAVGDGVADDVTAVQSAINEVARLGGGIVYFDPGTYKISAALTLTSKNGVSFIGAGSTVSIIKQSNATANCLTLTSCSGFFIEDIAFSHTSSSTGIGVSVSNCDRVRLQRVLVSAVYATGVQFSGTTTITSLDDCEILTVQGSAAARGVKYSGTGLYHWITDSIIGGGDTGASHIEFASTAGVAHVHRCYFPVLGSSTAINISGTGTLFSIVGNPSLISTATPFVFTGAQKVFQSGNGIEGYTIDVTTGGSVTPDLTRGNEIRIRGTTTGSAYTVNVPTIVPTVKGVTMILRFYANAGAPITGWGLVAGYHVSAAPSTTDTQITSYTFLYDFEASVWREISRTVTT